MSIDPTTQSRAGAPAEGAPSAPNNDAKAGAAFRAILERLEEKTRALGEASENLDDPSRLGELDRSEGDMVVALGKLGTSAQQLEIASSRLEDLDVTVRGLISNVEDADFSEVALDLQRAEQTLMLAQATGARLMQQSLLNYL